MRFVTKSKSMYEVDTALKKIRRLVGLGEATARIGKDGAWRPYVHISPIKLGKNVLIIWSKDSTPPLREDYGDDYTPATETSVVVRIDECGGD